MSLQYSSKADIDYLKQDEIGKVICKGLASLYLENPKFPVDYLAKWLLNYSASLSNENKLEGILQEKEVLKMQHQEQLEKNRQEQERVQQLKLKDEEIDNNFEEKVRNEEYHQELLVSEFPNFLEKRKNLVGVYIGIKDFPFKQINEEDEDEKAHLDQEAEKIIKYIGYSDSHKDLMSNKILSAKEEESVTAAVFKEREPVNEDDQENAGPPPPNYVYIPDLVKEPRMTYFRIPKLGSYIAFPLKYNSYLKVSKYQKKKKKLKKEEFFNDALQKRQEYQQELEKWTVEKKEKEEEFQKEIEALENDEEAQKEKQIEFDNFLEQYPEAPKEQGFLFEAKEYVLCADTMGQDREISQEDIKYLESYVQLFANSWEQTEKRLMSQDIDRYIQYLQEAPKDLIDQLNDEEAKAEEDKKSDYDHLKDNEKEYNYRLESVKLEALKEILKYEHVQKLFLDLKEYRVLKYPVILQNILYLLGYTMEEINIPKTHILNWKYVKTLLNEDFFNLLVNYNHQGPKPNKVKPYALINKIATKIEKFNQQEIDEYNIGYGRLFKWLQDTTRLRKIDIEVRKQQYADRVAEIEKKEAQLEVWENDKSTKLQEAKDAAAASEDPDSFVEEDWIAQWEEENPRPIVPERVVQDVDEDCLFE
ncbi:hypothetical protein IMG5_172240 [Ichthyophthirius multifiliis]|uniref:Dpy-30 motif protein n=1 Tax=Ichthyophthirius multifiliis TaxID=5932 RepID=G0R1Q9_ICHMU|nr:hypothetical protein IMG5_172240 [Ichthyophthirius multifiliis]EGR28594.1 hypothetical protein IMG5_172240 [Ichthyophthirius multifiliis]|eukprot:XP_004029830.1 hypothetical protein IMG5_172240 [Ichthyophthirius multifiliis]